MHCIFEIVEIDFYFRVFLLFQCFFDIEGNRLSLLEFHFICNHYWSNNISPISNKIIYSLLPNYENINILFWVSVLFFHLPKNPWIDGSAEPSITRSNDQEHFTRGISLHFIKVKDIDFRSNFSQHPKKWSHKCSIVHHRRFELLKLDRRDDF